MARPPTSLPPTTDKPLSVSLLLGSFTHDPAKFDLFDLYIPPSQPPPQHPDEASFHLRPEIKHTFRPDIKSPPPVVSAVFAVLVLSPWLVLLALVSPSLIDHTLTCFLNMHHSGLRSFLASHTRCHPACCPSSCLSDFSKVCCSGTGLTSNLVRCCCTAAS
jgi:hypothetical protein